MCRRQVTRTAIRLVYLKSLRTRNSLQRTEAFQGYLQCKIGPGGSGGGGKGGIKASDFDRKGNLKGAAKTPKMLIFCIFISSSATHSSLGHEQGSYSARTEAWIRPLHKQKCAASMQCNASNNITCIWPDTTRLEF